MEIESFKISWDYSSGYRTRGNCVFFVYYTRRTELHSTETGTKTAWRCLKRNAQCHNAIVDSSGNEFDLQLCAWLCSKVNQTRTWWEHDLKTYQAYRDDFISLQSIPRGLRICLLESRLKGLSVKHGWQLSWRKTGPAFFEPHKRIDPHYVFQHPAEVETSIDS